MKDFNPRYATLRHATPRLIIGEVTLRVVLRFGMARYLDELQGDYTRNCLCNCQAIFNPGRFLASEFTTRHMRRDNSSESCVPC